ncbi:MAG: phosphoadenosine phosphosulfate reductase domain-containing protein [Acidiferrobacteraceae bacterium]
MTTTVTSGLSREDLESYSTIIVAFSGGKDSLACLLDLIERGAPRDRIELWHHDVDGREGSTLMDWPITRDYCRAVAQAFGVKLYYSWKVGGFEREMRRHEEPTAPTAFEAPDGLHYVGGKGPPGTREQFPQVSADLSVRWCSAYLKIDVGACALRNQSRFDHARTLFVTGERAEESSARAKYKTFEPHRADARAGKKRRHVDQWRPVHAWSESRVWETLRRHGVVPHPAYQLGWGRVSCAACIFGSPNQWASLRAVNPYQFAKVNEYEMKWGKTIHRKLPIVTRAEAGHAYDAAYSLKVRALAMAAHWQGPIVVTPEEWTLPAGAFGESCGPT